MGEFGTGRSNLGAASICWGQICPEMEEQLGRATPAAPVTGAVDLGFAEAGGRKAESLDTPPVSPPFPGEAYGGDSDPGGQIWEEGWGENASAGENGDFPRGETAAREG